MEEDDNDLLIIVCWIVSVLVLLVFGLILSKI